MHALGEIRTHNVSTRSATDLRLSPRGHWDRHYANIEWLISVMDLREINDKDGGRWKLCYPVDWKTFMLAVMKLRTVLLERWIICQISLR
jgi:hypothetical protein